MIWELAFQYSIRLFFALVVDSGSSNFSQQLQSLWVRSCGHLVDLQEHIHVEQFETHMGLTEQQWREQDLTSVGEKVQELSTGNKLDICNGDVVFLSTY